MNTPPAQRPRAGMTLMELMVGLTLTAMMAATGMAAFGSIIDHRRTITRSTVEVERASALRDQLRLWIGSGTVLIQTGGVPNIGGRNSVAIVGGSVTAAAATGDELTVNTSAANPANSPNARLRLFVDGDDATPEHGLALEYQASNQSPLQRMQLEASIGTMTVEFLDQRTSRWRPASEAATIQAIAVRLTLGAPRDSTIAPLLTLPLVFPMNANTATAGPNR